MAEGYRPGFSSGSTSSMPEESDNSMSVEQRVLIYASRDASLVGHLPDADEVIYQHCHDEEVQQDL